MNKELVEEICKKNNLGNVIRDVCAVSGGLLHKMWHIETEKGQYAINELNEEIIKRVGVIDSFELSESIAAQLVTVSIPAIAGLPNSSRVVQNISGVAVIVYEWIEGFTLSTDAASPDQAYLIGKLIGEIHKVNLKESRVQIGLPQVFTNEHWQKVIAEFQERFPESILKLDQIIEWNSRTDGLLHKLELNLVVTHGDIDQKNVIWKDNSHPYIIDWESVSRTNPGLEIVDASLNWGGLVSGKIDTKSKEAVMCGYKSVGMSVSENISDLLLGCVMKWLPWLEFNIRRAVTSPKNTKEYELGLSQTENTIRSISLILENIDTWSENGN